MLDCQCFVSGATMKRRTLPAILCLAALALELVASAGCVDVTVDTRINPDGSGRRGIETVLDRDLSDLVKLSGGSAAAGFEKQLRDSLPQNAKLSTFTRDGQLHYVATFSFASAADLTLINRGASHRQGPLAPSATLRIGGNPFVTTYSFNENLPPVRQPLTSEEASLTRTFTVNYRLHLPGTITSSNADRLIGASSAQWRIPITRGRRVAATSRSVNWPLAAGSAAIVITLVAAGVIVVVVIRRRLAREGASPTEVEQ